MHGTHKVQLLNLGKIIDSIVPANAATVPVKQAVIADNQTAVRFGTVIMGAYLDQFARQTGPKIFQNTDPAGSCDFLVAQWAHTVPPYRF